jgi:hypothetical protein
METTQLWASADQARAALEVLAAATEESEVETQSAQVDDSVLTGSTYFVVVRVEARVMVVVSSTAVQSPQVPVSLSVVAGSTGTLVDQSPQVSVAVVAGSTAVVADAAFDASQSAQSKLDAVSVLVVAGSTGVVAVNDLDASQSAQSKLEAVTESVVSGSTGVEEELLQSAQVCSTDAVLEVFAGSTAREVDELQSSQRNELDVVPAVELVVAGLTGVSFVVVLAVVFPSTGVFETESVVVFQSTQVLRATFS